MLGFAEYYLQAASRAVQSPIWRGLPANPALNKKALSQWGSHSGPARAYEQKAMAGGQRENLASLTEIVRRDPTDVNALNMRGTAFARGQQFDKAMADFNAAIDMDPQYYQAYANRALATRA